MLKIPRSTDNHANFGHYYYYYYLGLPWRRTRWQPVAAAPVGFQVFGRFLYLCFDFHCELWQLFSSDHERMDTFLFELLRYFRGTYYDVSASPSNGGLGAHH